MLKKHLFQLQRLFFYCRCTDSLSKYDYCTQWSTEAEGGSLGTQPVTFLPLDLQCSWRLYVGGFSDRNCRDVISLFTRLRDLATSSLMHIVRRVA